MPTIMIFGDSNIQDGLVVTELRDVHGYTPVGSQENPAGIFHEGYISNRNAFDMVVNAGFPVHFTQANNFESSWVSGSPVATDIPDYVVIAFGTNHLRRWVSGNGDHYYYPQMTAAFSGQLIQYFKRIWPSAKVIATLFVNGNDDPGHANWDAYEVFPYNAPVGTGRDFWIARRDEYAAEFEAHYAGLADGYARFDLDGSVAFSDDVHMTAAGITEYAVILNAAILGLGTFVPPTFVEPNKITIFGQIRNMLGSPVENAELRITPQVGGLFHGTPPRLLVGDVQTSAPSDSNGYLQMDFYETETVRKSVLVELVINAKATRSVVTQLPNQTSINLEDLFS